MKLIKYCQRVDLSFTHCSTDVFVLPTLEIFIGDEFVSIGFHFLIWEFDIDFNKPTFYK